MCLFVQIVLYFNKKIYILKLYVLEFCILMEKLNIEISHDFILGKIKWLTFIL